jgi:hypothetical protein
MRRHIQELPSDLPHARLYLDDIETVTRILSAAIAEAEAADIDRLERAKNKSLSGDKLAIQTSDRLPAVLDDVKVVYRIGQEEMDSIDDLLDQGGSVTNLQVRVFTPRIPWNRCELDFSWASKPRLRLSFDKKSNEWEIHAKVRDVFERRRSVVKNLVEDLPYSIKTVAWIIMASGPSIAIALKGTARLVVEVFVGSVFLVFLLGFVVLVRPSRVYLVRRHEQSRTKSEARYKFWKGAGIFVLGALFTKLLDYLYTHFVK